jgi:hypothetical protein
MVRRRQAERLSSLIVDFVSHEIVAGVRPSAPRHQPKALMKRDEFDKHFQAYRSNLREEIIRFRGFVSVLRQIEDRKSDHLDAINLAPAFFQVVQSALFSGIILWADKLLDQKGQRGFFNFLTFIEQNRKWLSVKQLQARRQYPDDHWMLENRIPITLKSIEEDRVRLASLPAVKSLRIRRDKFHGHFDKEYFFDRAKLEQDAPLLWKDVNEVAEVMGQLLNNYSVDFDGASYAWDPINIDDLDVLLIRARRGRIKKSS